MKVKYLKLKSWLLASVMGGLGFGSCHSHKQLAQPVMTDTVEVRDRGEMMLMYGVPTMDYMIRGSVRDVKGRPVRDVRVNIIEEGIEATADTVMGDPEAVRRYLENSAVVTDEQGRYELNVSSRPWERVRVLVRDVDGEANGSFRNQLLDIKVDAEHVDTEGSDGWFVGTFRKQVDVKLERK